MSPLISRRECLCRSAFGMGALALAGLLDDAGFFADAAGAELAPLAPKKPQFAPKAKRVIHLFMNGGPSQVDTFDYKPELANLAGKDLPNEIGKAFPSPFKFEPRGASGIAVSEIFPKLGACVDDLCMVRSMHTDDPGHETATSLLNTGAARLIRPSVGAWVTYGLGTVNQNLPGFVAMCPGGFPLLDNQNWQAGFLPGAYQGTYIDTQHTAVERLIENIKNSSTPLARQRKQLDLLKQLNAEHQAGRGGDAQLEARIQSFELAYRMQQEAALVFDVSGETQETRDLYGDTVQGRQMLIARRLAEKGVRFVQAWAGPGLPWDAHSDIANNHKTNAQGSDQAIAALLTDLKRKGMLKDTLVIWGGEFGRLPSYDVPPEGQTPDQVTGRGHNHAGFSVWLAGGGVKAGHVHGATDELGHMAEDKPVHVRDLHATILHLLGFDHEKLTYRYAGRDFRLTDVAGKVVKELIA